MSDLNIPEINKNNCFHFIRLICCLIVIYEHIVVLSNLSLITLNIRGYAVDVFFILSGFWVTFSFLRSNNICDFYKKRIKKIFPQYLIVVFCFAFFLVTFSDLSFGEYYSSFTFWKYIIANSLTLNFIQPTLPGVFQSCGLNGAVNGSLWTIKVELGFYVILPLIIHILKKDFNKWFKFIFLICIYVLSELYIPLCKKLALLSSIENQLPAYLCYFVSGIGIFVYWEQFNKFSSKLIIPIIIIFGISVYTKFVFLIPICLTFIVFWIAIKFSFLSKITKIDYSYSLYLVHFPIIQMLNTTNVFLLYPIFGCILVLGLSFIISYFLNIIQARIS